MNINLISDYELNTCTIVITYLKIYLSWLQEFCFYSLFYILWNFINRMYREEIHMDNQNSKFHLPKISAIIWIQFNYVLLQTYQNQKLPSDAY